MKATTTFTAILAACVVLGIGCSNSPIEEESADVKVSETPADAHGHEHADHDHPSTGPHGGKLIELGNEQYHAELVGSDDEGTLTIYLLGGDAKEAVAIDAAELFVNVRQAGKGEQFKLVANPEAGDPAGKSSRYVSNVQALGAKLDADGAEARLVVEIEGKSYTGEIK